MRFPVLVALAPLIFAAACATAPQAPVAQSAQGRVGGSTYGLFLAGQAALAQGRSVLASQYFDTAAADPNDGPVIAEQAFSAAVLAGDIPKALVIAPKGDDASEGVKRLYALVSAVNAIGKGQGAEAQAILTGDAVGFPHRSVAALLAPWAAAQAGDAENALVRPSLGADKLTDYFGQLGQGYLFERAKRFDEAETDFKAVAAGDDPPDLAVLAYGGFLERRGRRPEAVTLYDATLARDPSAAAVRFAQTRAAAGKAAPPAPTVRQGAAQALTAGAVGMLAIKGDQIGQAYLRLALHLDPTSDEAWLLLGDVLRQSGDMEGARSAYARPKAGSPYYATGQAKLAWTFQEDDSATAMQYARAAAAGGDPDAELALADILRANDRYDEAAVVLDKLVARSEARDWRLLYARGVAYERTNRWSLAEADLQAALKLKPEEPELLNYLGYSWIDRGERLPEALAMVQKAVGLRPRSGAMVDSLGWAYYRMGDYKKAVETLEQAVELEAGDPEINDHLGDAYWRVGRRAEAQFQWRRVLTLRPDDKIKARAEAKLKDGLEAGHPAPAVG